MKPKCPAMTRKGRPCKNEVSDKNKQFCNTHHDMPSKGYRRKKLSKSVRKQVKKKRTTCYLCGHLLAGRQIHIDHVFPVSKGKSFDIFDNLLPVHAECNLIKGDLHPIEAMYKIKKIINRGSR